MSEYRSLIIIYFLVVALTTVYVYNLYINWPTVRARIASDWSSPILENFAMELPDQSALDEYAPGKPVSDSTLLLSAPATTIGELVGSEDCYRATAVPAGGSYDQTTNNCMRVSPESCTGSPLIGRFYA